MKQLRQRKRIRPGQGWLERVRIALDIDYEKLQEITGLSAYQVHDLCMYGHSTKIADDELFENLLNYVNERIGMAVALRGELGLLANKLHDEREAQRERIKNNV